MYPAKDARELAILLRISRELDVVGDVTATVDNPSELLAWALALSQPDVVAWRAEDSGHRYLQVTADRHRPPIRGRVTAVLACDQHHEFWNALGLDQLATGEQRGLSVGALSSAWAVMPVTPAPADAGPGKSAGPHPPSPPPAHLQTTDQD
jgi:hypothetical protein